MPQGTRVRQRTLLESSFSLCGFGDGTQVTSQTLAFLLLWTCDWLTREMTDVTRCVTDVLRHRNRNEEHAKDLIFTAATQSMV